MGIKGKRKLRQRRGYQQYYDHFPFIINPYQMKKLSFAIIGGGPAAFYLSKCLAKLPQQPLLHIFEKEYCPFGLIRYGVAPDHISIKKSETTLSSISSYEGFKYYGNQEVDENLLGQLRQQYSGVIYAFGAQSNNEPSWFKACKEGKGSSYVINARDIVYWYNNHPRYESYQLDLANIRNVIIIGNGNVAIDIARVFLKKVEELANTQISNNALASLANSKVQNVTIIGRRGFTHSAFALKELRELSQHKIPIYCIEEELEASMNESSYIECTSLGNHNAAIVRMNKRKIDFLKEKCHMIKLKDLKDVMEKQEKKLILRYLLDPVEVIEAKHLRLSVNKLKGQPFKQVAEKSGREETIGFDLLINSTGFKVESIVPAELDQANNKIFNSNGCILTGDNSSKVSLGQYAVGWCKSGPRGVIDQTLLGSEETFNNIRIHINNQVLSEKSTPSFNTSSNISFDRYIQLKQIELQRGDKEKFIKKKFNIQEIKQFFGC